MPQDTLDLLRMDVSSHAKTLTALIEDQRDMKNILSQMQTAVAVRVTEDRFLNERLDRIEKSIDGLQSIGKWILAAFATVFIAAMANFILEGGLHAVATL